MEVRWSRRFEAERERFRFAFTCEECRYFNECTRECVHGYPNEQHLRSRYVPAREDAPAIVFCKEFELG